MKKTGEHPSLEERIQRLEDQQAIYQLISAYGPAADSCNMADIARIWAADGSYEIGGIGTFEGIDGIEAVFNGEFHQAMVAGGSAHASTFPHVVIDGDRASATHYGTLYGQREGRFVCVRLIASRWLLERAPDRGWQVRRRTNVLLDGNPAARELLARTMQGPDAAAAESGQRA